jgi:hypothetical protein
MSREPWQPLLDLLTELRAEWPGGAWTWDPRFECATSAVEGAASIAKARELAGARLPLSFDATSLGAAPDDVRALAKSKGGLRQGQEILCSAPVEGMRLYLLWWPWNGGGVVSGRFGVANPPRPNELLPLLRASFGLA